MDVGWKPGVSTEHDVCRGVAAPVRRHIDRPDPATPLAQLLAAIELAELRLVVADDPYPQVLLDFVPGTGEPPAAGPSGHDLPALADRRAHDLAFAAQLRELASA